MVGAILRGRWNGKLYASWKSLLISIILLCYSEKEKDSLANNTYHVLEKYEKCWKSYLSFTIRQRNLKAKILKSSSYVFYLINLFNEWIIGEMHLNLQPNNEQYQLRAWEFSVDFSRQILIWASKHYYQSLRFWNAMYIQYFLTHF